MLAKKLSRGKGAHTIRGSNINRARSSRSTASLLRIAHSGTSSTYCTVTSELTRVGTAVFVAGIANRIRLKLASRRITTGISCTSGGSSTITVLPGLYNSVPTLTSGKDGNILIRRQATSLDTVASKSGADVANTASRELLDVGPSAWVHDKRSSRVTCRRAQRTALLRCYCASVRTSRGGTVVDGTKSMSRLVSQNLPLRTRFHNHIRTADSFIHARIRCHSRCRYASLTKPGQTNSGLCSTCT